MRGEGAQPVASFSGYKFKFSSCVHLNVGVSPTMDVNPASEQ